MARATGRVVVTRDGNVFSGPELQLKVERFEGFFRSPSYRFARTGAGGKARLIEFIDDQRAAATDATYSSCTIEDADGEPVWILKRASCGIDGAEAGEGVARDGGAALSRCADPRRAGAELSSQRRRRVGAPAAQPRHRQTERLPCSRSPTTGTSRPTATRPSTPPESHATRAVGFDSEFRYLEPPFLGR